MKAEAGARVARGVRKMRALRRALRYVSMGCSRRNTIKTESPPLEGLPPVH